jgi:hypothetical protein
MRSKVAAQVQHGWGAFAASADVKAVDDRPRMRALPASASMRRAGKHPKKVVMAREARRTFFG